MEERCILVTADDVAYGEESKKTCKYYCGEMVAPCPRAQSLIPSAFIV
jgi:hypothetical protein